MYNVDAGFYVSWFIKIKKVIVSVSQIYIHTNNVHLIFLGFLYLFIFSYNNCTYFFYLKS